MLDDYSRNSAPSDFDSRGGIPSLKRPRLDPLVDGHWANAPTDRRGGSFQSQSSQIPHWRQTTTDNANNMVEESLDDTLMAALPFFSDSYR